MVSVVIKDTSFPSRHVVMVYSGLEAGRHVAGP